MTFDEVAEGARLWIDRSTRFDSFKRACEWCEWMTITGGAG